MVVSGVQAVPCLAGAELGRPLEPIQPLASRGMHPRNGPLPPSRGAAPRRAAAGSVFQALFERGLAFHNGLRNTPNTPLQVEAFKSDPLIFHGSLRTRTANELLKVSVPVLFHLTLALTASC